MDQHGTGFEEAASGKYNLKKFDLSDSLEPFEKNKAILLNGTVNVSGSSISATGQIQIDGMEGIPSGKFTVKLNGDSDSGELTVTVNGRKANPY